MSSQKNDSLRIGIGFLFVVFSRLIPHPVNMTAVGAFAGQSYFAQKAWYAAALSVLALFISDLILGFHSTQIFVYAAFSLTAILASFQKWEKFRLLKLSALSVFIFFLISNFGVWLVGGLYPTDMNGLVSCYVAALPFLPQEFLANLFYGFLISKVFDFGIMKLVRVKA